MRPLARRHRLIVAGLAGITGVVTFATSLAAQGSPPASGASANAAAKPDIRYRYRLLGVFDEASGEPIEGVEVSDMLSGLSSLTTKTGTVSLIFLPDGGSFVRLRKVGYGMQTFPVAISPTDTAPLTVILQKSVELPTVVVKDSAPKYVSTLLQGAEARMNSHQGGYFIDEAEMRKHDNSTMTTTIISKMPGLMTQQGSHAETYLVSSRSPCIHSTLAGSCKQPNCFVSVYLDGIKIFDPTTSTVTMRPDFNRLFPQDYAIAEFYPSAASVPAEYGAANNPCGVLLLWSRER